MAEEQAEKKAPAKAGPKPNSLVMRGSEAWREWLNRAAGHDRTTVADFLDRAAACYARKIGFEEKAPKR